MSEKNTDPDTKKSKKDSRHYALNRIIIIVVFLCFAAAAFYLSFQAPDQLSTNFIKNSNYNDSITEKIDKYIWKKYKEYETNDVKPILAESEAATNHCYVVSYVNQIDFVNQLRGSLVEGQKPFGLLNKLNLASNNDSEIASLVSNLQKVFEYNETYTTHEIQSRFELLRKEISKALCQEKTQNSFIMKSLMEVIVIQKRGNRALEAGGADAILEKSSRLIKEGNIRGAYSELNNLEKKYHDIASPWFMYTERYLNASKYIDQIVEYIGSENYRKKFYKECK